MTRLTVLKELAYTPSFIEEQTEAALAAVGRDLPQAKVLSLDYLAEDVGRQTLDLWRELILLDDRSVTYLKTLHLPQSLTHPAGGEATAGVYLDALQRALTTGDCLDSESLFVRAGNREVMLYYQPDTGHDVHLSGDPGLLSDATRMYCDHLGEPRTGDVFIRKCNARGAKAQGLTLAEQETSKAINMMVHYVSSSNGVEPS